jgi:hypothetical protein
VSTSHHSEGHAKGRRRITLVEHIHGNLVGVFGDEFETAEGLRKEPPEGFVRQVRFQTWEEAESWLNEQPD